MATRLYFPATEAAPVTPAYQTGWNYVSEYLSRKLANVKGTSAITVGVQIGPWTSGNMALDRQYVSAGMAAGVVFNTSTTVKGQLMVREYATADNVDRIIMGIRIVNSAGTTVQATLLAVGSYAVAAEFINNATHRNKKIADGDALTGTYTTVLGDRLVIELGYTDASGSTPEGSAKWGENGTDLPENETQTTDAPGWIEFSNTITWAGQDRTFVADLQATSDLVVLCSPVRNLVAGLQATSDLTILEQVDRPIVVASGATSDLSITFGIDRDVSSDLQASSDLQTALTIERIKSFAADLQATSDISVLSEMDRGLGSDIQVSSDLDGAISIDRLVDCPFDPTSNLVVVSAVDRSMGSDLQVPSDLTAKLSSDRPIVSNLAIQVDMTAAIDTAKTITFAANLQVDGEFDARVAQDRSLVSSMQVSSDIAEQISVDRVESAEMQVAVDLASATQVDRRCVADSIMPIDLVAGLTVTHASVDLAANIGIDVSLSVATDIIRYIQAGLNQSVDITILLNVTENLVVSDVTETWKVPSVGKTYSMPATGRKWAQPVVGKSWSLN